MTDKSTTLAAALLAEIEQGIKILRKVSPPDQDRLDRLVRLTEVCQDFCVNGQVLFLGWGAGEGCPFPCPSM
jgi:hypothetical protein